MKFKKRYLIIFVPIVLILLVFAGYSIKKNIAVKKAPANKLTSSTKGTVTGTGTNTNSTNTSTGKNNTQNTAPSSAPTAASKDTTSSGAELSAPNIDKVKDLTKQLSSEKQVSDYQIYIKDNMHFATITFKKDADSKTAKNFATKYADLIKKAYNDKNVNVEIVQNDKTIATVVLK